MQDTNGEQIMNRLGLEPLLQRQDVLHECEVCGAPVADEKRDEHNRRSHATEATLGVMQKERAMFENLPEREGIFVDAFLMNGGKDIRMDGDKALGAAIEAVLKHERTEELRELLGRTLACIPDGSLAREIEAILKR